MRSTARITAFAALSLMVLAGAPTSVTAQDAHPLNGAWLVQSWTAPDGTVNDAQRGLFIFVVTREDGGNYSMMFVPGTEPRAEYAGEDPNDEDKLAAYDSFIANSGRLVLDGHQFTLDAYMAKDPNYMADFGQDLQTFTWAIEGNTLTLTWDAGFFEGARTTLQKPM